MGESSRWRKGSESVIVSHLQLESLPLYSYYSATTPVLRHPSAALSPVVGVISCTEKEVAIDAILTMEKRLSGPADVHYL